MSKFAQIIREKRAAMNLSLRSAAELIGISHTYLDKLEKGMTLALVSEINQLQIH